MDGIVCPRFFGIVKLTQKLMTKVHKKKDENGNDFCPICGCSSPKGNLCKACFMRSFTPITYSRNIKVVEQNQYFYGMKNRRWGKKPDDASAKLDKYGVEDKVEKDILSYVVSATRRSSFDNSQLSVEAFKDDGLSPDDPSIFEGKEVSELFQPAAEEAVDLYRESGESQEGDRPDEFVQVELTEDNEEPESDFGALPKFVPDFWESVSEEDGTHKFSERLKMLTNCVVKEVQRPFREIFGDTHSDSGVSVKDKSNHEGDEDRNSMSASRKSNEGSIAGVQKTWKQTQTESTQSNLDASLKDIIDSSGHDCALSNKQVKQKATLELFKVAFKTNMILNSLFYYFKKAVESDGSEPPSDNYEEADEPIRSDGMTTTDCKISIDSFFFPNKRSAVLWGCEGRSEDIAQSGDENPGNESNQNASTENSSTAQDSKSQVEVLSKSQATLSMLMNRNQCWMKFGQDNVQHDVNIGVDDSYNLYTTEHNSEAQQYLSRLHVGTVEQQDNLVDSTMGTRFKIRGILDRVSCSEGDCSQPKVTRKFFSQHSTLVVTDRGEETGLDENFESASEYVSSAEDSATKTDGNSDSESASKELDFSVYSSLVEVSDEFHPQPTHSDHSQISLLDLVFGLNRTCAKPSLLPLPDCQQDLITLSTPGSSKEALAPRTERKRKDAISQTFLSSKHLEQEMSLLHKAFLDQLAHFSVQLVDSCKTFGHSWQTSFLAELVDHFRSACNIISAIIGDSQPLAVPSSDRLDELQNISNKISLCLAKLRAHPHSFIGDCTDHDISTLLSSPPGQEPPPLVNTWV